MRWLLLLSIFALSACPPASVPEAADPARDPDWWRGTWVVDVERLNAEAGADGLSPDARAIAAALVESLAPIYRYELGPGAFSRRTPQGEEVSPARVRSLGPDGVELEGAEVRLRLERRPGGAVLSDGGRELPVRRVDEG